MPLDKYLPVDPDFEDIIDQLALKNKQFRVVFFGADKSIQEINGIYKAIFKSTAGHFVTLKNEQEARLDRIITINGRPGPAYDEYNEYAIRCASCMSGLDKSE